MVLRVLAIADSSEACEGCISALSACTLLIFTDLGILSIAYGLALKVFFKGISFAPLKPPSGYSKLPPICS